MLRELLRCLTPVCERIESASHPTVHALRHLLHLRSPVAACRREPGHVLELVERLHPTPAVGGVPTEQALRWISDHEPSPRGWYAGAGIVRHSDPPAEYAETTLKLAALRTALGVNP